MRSNDRKLDELRPIKVIRHFTRGAPGSVYIKAGCTTLLCTASIEDSVPDWKKEQKNPTGWVTAEYSMLPGSTSPRKRRERGRIDGRSSEIQRLIGRSLRAAVDMQALGPRTVTVDCDVLEADGGTRTLSVTGGFIALVDALASIKSQLSPDRPVLTHSVAAVSVGVVESQIRLDLDYNEDSSAGVDMNVVATGDGQFIEVQGTAEGLVFSRESLDEQLDLATRGIAMLTERQQQALGNAWPFS